MRDRHGRIVELKAHRATWSGAHPENSLAGLRECYAQRLARVEIDFRLDRGELIVSHDARELEGALLLRDALEIVRTAPPGPTMLMLDAKDEAPWSPAEVERIARLIEPVRDRVFVGSPADWNLRRLRATDPDVALAFDPQYYFDRKGSRSPLPGGAGAYGYHDAHPLAFRRTVPVAEYVRERLEGLARLVPGIREMHLHLGLFEQMQGDGVDVCAVVHGAGAQVDVWTLDAGTPRWRERLERALAAGVDIVTTNTPRELSAVASTA
jgi:glycerophosphoryl diester phosphodiesterase